MALHPPQRPAPALRALAALVLGVAGCATASAVSDEHPDLRGVLREEGPVLGLAFSPDGARLAVATHAFAFVRATLVVSVHDVASAEQRELARLPAYGDERVHPLAFSPDGALVAAASTDRGATPRDLESAVHLLPVDGDGPAPYDPPSELRGPGVITSLAFSPAGDEVVACFAVPVDWWQPGDATTRVVRWNLETGEVTQARDDGAFGWSARLSPDAGRVAFVDAPGEATRVEVLDLATGERLAPRTPVLHHGGAGSLGEGMDAAFSANGTALAVGLGAGSSGSSVVLVDLARGESVVHAERGRFLPPCVAIAPDGSLVASGTLAGGGFELWRAADGERAAAVAPAPVEWRPMGTLADTFSVAFAPDGRTLAVGDRDGRVLLWNVDRLLGRAPVGPPASP